MGNETDNASPHTDPTAEPHPPIYKIRVKGCMDEGFWADWFGGMECSVNLDCAETTLRGPLSDQAELYGLLSRLRNKGLTLISVQLVRQDTDITPDQGAIA